MQPQCLVSDVRPEVKPTERWDSPMGVSAQQFMDVWHGFLLIANSGKYTCTSGATQQGAKLYRI